jgi:tRNA-specific 2-thiouridylase
LLACNKINISECNWIIDNPKKTKFNVLVKLRNSSTPVRGVVDVNIDNGTSELNFDEPQYGISIGQAAVFYNIEEHSHVLGGGWIVDAPNMFSQL